ncbi:MAG: glycosyltransferase family 4 protein [Acidobacteria bacterium]|nr:glycosyltransferase family 4 protein [Acidobacteriota bacterium]
MSDRATFPEGLRVAVLSRSVFPLHGVGGLERHVYDLVAALARRDVRITLITREGRDPVSLGALDDPRVTIRTIPYRTFPGANRRGTTILDRSTAYPLFGYRAGRAAAALVDARQVDLVYGLGASTLGYAIARSRRRLETRPFVFNPQGLEEFGGMDGSYGGRRAKRIGYAPLRCAVRICSNAADRVIATDRAIEPAIARHLGVGPDRMRLVPNAIDLAGCEAQATSGDGEQIRARYGILPEETVLLSVGRIERNKGFHVLVDALAAMRDLPWRWVLVGDGPLRVELEERVRGAGLADRMLLLGRLDDRALHAWYEAATLFVHPTLYEGSSIVTLEAMAHRRAVVASRAGGLPDKVRDGHTGWLVPPGNAQALATTLRVALAEPGRLSEMGLAGRALVDAEFSWTTVTDRLLAVFSELLYETRSS